MEGEKWKFNCHLTIFLKLKWKAHTSMSSSLYNTPVINNVAVSNVNLFDLAMLLWLNVIIGH